MLQPAGAAMGWQYDVNTHVRPNVYHWEPKAYQERAEVSEPAQAHQSAAPAREHMQLGQHSYMSPMPLPRAAPAWPHMHTPACPISGVWWRVEAVGARCRAVELVS